MSSLKKAMNSARKVHKERSQPAKRAKLGLLEKHKDYVQRARNFHAKEKRILALQVRFCPLFALILPTFSPPLLTLCSLLLAFPYFLDSSAAKHVSRPRPTCATRTSSTLRCKRYGFNDM